MSTLIRTARFGVIEVAEEDTIVFEEGLVGLPDRVRYALIQHREGSPFRWLQSLDDGDLAFLVVDPQVYDPSYKPLMPRSDSEALELEEGTPILVYTICSIPSGDPGGMTLNLAGPVVINAATRRARQVVLEDPAFPVRWAVFTRETVAA